MEYGKRGVLGLVWGCQRQLLGEYKLDFERREATIQTEQGKESHTEKEYVKRTRDEKGPQVALESKSSARDSL